jgi:hypothetical protein
MAHRKQADEKNSNMNVFLNPLTDFGFKKVFLETPPRFGQTSAGDTGSDI